MWILFVSIIFYPFSVTLNELSQRLTFAGSPSFQGSPAPAPDAVQSFAVPQLTLNQLVGGSDCSVVMIVQLVDESIDCSVVIMSKLFRKCFLNRRLERVLENHISIDAKGRNAVRCLPSPRTGELRLREEPGGLSSVAVPGSEVGICIMGHIMIHDYCSLC